MQLLEADQEIPGLLCAAATLRRTTRAVAHLYAEEFGGLVDGPQFSLLALINRSPGTNQSALGRILILDKTTLSRNLRLMQRQGWVEPVASGDKRERGFQLTADGSRLLKRARPAWQRAQNRLQSALGPAGWTRLFKVANSVTRIAHAVQNSK